ncbi:MAG: pyridoxamine 5'-phosphate oxidase family protein [Candidatus Poribacteria bacterium]
MAAFFDSLEEKHQEFIAAQHMFFTATAPAIGRLNLSPKGMDTFRVLNERRVAYLDLTGSGNEAAAHLADSSRMTIMLCSFDRSPLIMRLYGAGRSVRPGDADWDELHSHFTPEPGTRQIIVLDIESVQTSCGYAVPTYDFVAERDTLRKYAENKGEDGMAEYRRENNRVSIDGRPIQG